jgi:hypothetical protein
MGGQFTIVRLDFGPRRVKIGLDHDDFGLIQCKIIVI